MENIGTSLLQACIINNIRIKHDMSLHLAIVNQPFLNFILQGQKTIESRFSINKCSPYKKVKIDDVLFFKDSGKPVISFSMVKSVKYFELNKTVLETLKLKYAKEICAENNTFWIERQDKKYATLIWLDKPQNISIFPVQKKDKRGWIDYKLKYPPKIIVISGKIGSGKTYWSNLLSKQFDCNRNSFSDYLKLFLLKNNLEVNRENLQKAGEYCIQNKFEEFMDFTLFNNFNTSSDILIIDGLRHIKALQYIKEHSTKVLHIHVNINENLRETFLIKRDNTFNNRFDKQAVESETLNLCNCADIVIDNNTDLNTLSKEIKNYFNNIQLTFLNS